MSVAEPQVYYQKRLTEINEKLSAFSRKRGMLSWARLAVIAVLIFSVVWLWPSGLRYVLMSMVPFLVLFGYLVSLTLKLDEKIRHLNYLIRINEAETKSLSGHYPGHDDGSVYLKEQGAGGNDLDVFGPSSLFLFINRAWTEQGKNILAELLLTTPGKGMIKERQEAVRELEGLMAWRQQLQAYSMYNPVTVKAEKTIESWLGEHQTYFNKPIWKILRFTIPVISTGILLLYIADLVPVNLFNIVMLSILAFALGIGKKISTEYGHLSKIVNELDTFLYLLNTAESAPFKSPLLVSLQKRLTEGHSASYRIRQLKRILNRFDYRLNPLVYIPLSIFLLWDLQQIFALENWKKSQAGQVGEWYQAIGEAEALASLATLAFNHPKWVFPEISASWFDLEGKDLGHPLIHASRSVTNDLNMEGLPKFIMLTGSNMAGKSTFLRTLGTNMILAMTGAPVCASRFRVPVVKVMSSMRIADNLEEETSTFHAELKKLKYILEAVNRNEKVFLLLDEMLRGTNAIDRHKGSVALIRQLIRKKAVGIIASHDISLTELAAEYPEAISNYHFDSIVINNEIVFDYKLKPGVCLSANATLLMKKIGIDLEEE